MTLYGKTGIWYWRDGKFNYRKYMPRTHYRFRKVGGIMTNNTVEFFNERNRILRENPSPEAVKRNKRKTEEFRSMVGEITEEHFQQNKYDPIGDHLAKSKFIMTDITEHEFSDEFLSIDNPTSDEPLFFMVRNTYTWPPTDTSLSLDKSDAIAIAKHFGLIKTKTKQNRLCTKCGTHLAYNAPKDSCLCGSTVNIIESNVTF